MVLLTISSTDAPAARTESSAPAGRCFQDDIVMGTALAVVTAPASPRPSHETSQTTVALLEAQIVEERRSHRLQRANAEQARRVADCLHSIHAIVLRQLSQACFALDESDLISYCNPAFCTLTERSEEELLRQPVVVCLPEAAGAKLRACASTLRRQAELADPGIAPVLLMEELFETTNGKPIRRLKLIPQYRIPGVLESILVLLDS